MKRKFFFVCSSRPIFIYMCRKKEKKEKRATRERQRQISFSDNSERKVKQIFNCCPNTETKKKKRREKVEVRHQRMLKSMIYLQQGISFPIIKQKKRCKKKTPVNPIYSHTKHTSFSFFLVIKYLLAMFFFS